MGLNLVIPLRALRGSQPGVSFLSLRACVGLNQVVPSLCVLCVGLNQVVPSLSLCALRGSQPGGGLFRCKSTDCPYYVMITGTITILPIIFLLCDTELESKR